MPLAAPVTRAVRPARVRGSCSGVREFCMGVTVRTSPRASHGVGAHTLGRPHGGGVHGAVRRARRAAGGPERAQEERRTQRRAADVPLPHGRPGPRLVGSGSSSADRPVPRTRRFRPLARRFRQQFRTPVRSARPTRRPHRAPTDPATPAPPRRLRHRLWPARRARRASGPRRRPLALDLCLDATVVLPDLVAREVERAATILTRLCARPY
ncbi:hypothetical protein DLE01_04475, partial [Streptomyces sp. FT05W]